MFIIVVLQCTVLVHPTEVPWTEKKLTITFECVASVYIHVQRTLMATIPSRITLFWKSVFVRKLKILQSLGRLYDGLAFYPLH